MHLHEASIRFGLLLEAYCRGCGAHLPELALQVSQTFAVGFVVHHHAQGAIHVGTGPRCRFGQTQGTQQAGQGEAGPGFHRRAPISCLFLNILEFFIRQRNHIAGQMRAAVGSHVPHQVSRMPPRDGLQEIAALAQVYRRFMKTDVS